MSKSGLSEKSYVALVTFLLRVKRQAMAIGMEFELTASQILTLLMIDTTQPPSMSSFCKLYACDASNITGIIDGLEEKGLVRRTPHPSDRRVKMISLQPAGKRLQANLIKQLTLSSDRLFTTLNQSELKQFTALIEKLAI